MKFFNDTGKHVERHGRKTRSLKLRAMVVRSPKGGFLYVKERVPQNKKIIFYVGYMYNQVNYI